MLSNKSSTRLTALGNQGPNMISNAPQKNTLTPERHMHRGVALLPDQSYSAQFIELQRQARTTFEISPTLSLSGNLPHITLVQGTFGTLTDFQPFLDSARASVSDHGLTTAHPTRLVYKPRGWIFLEVENGPALDATHRSVADLASAHLTPPTDLAKIGDYSDAEKANYLRYGYRYMYDSFYPHLTLGRVQSEPSAEQMQHINELAHKLNLFSPCPISRATIYEMGENGAHARTVLSCDLRDIR